MMRCFVIVWCGAALLAAAGDIAHAAAPWMPEYEVGGRRVNAEGRLSGRRINPEFRRHVRLPDLEDDALTGRRIVPKDPLGARRFSPEYRVGRRVNVHEKYVGRLADLEQELRATYRPARTDKIVGRRVSVPDPGGAQHPTPSDEH